MDQRTPWIGTDPHPQVQPGPALISVRKSKPTSSAPGNPRSPRTAETGQPGQGRAVRTGLVPVWDVQIFEKTCLCHPGSIRDSGALSSSWSTRTNICTTSIKNFHTFDQGTYVELFQSWRTVLLSTPAWTDVHQHGQTSTPAWTDVHLHGKTQSSSGSGSYFCFLVFLFSSSPYGPTKSNSLGPGWTQWSRDSCYLLDLPVKLEFVRRQQDCDRQEVGLSYCGFGNANLFLVTVHLHPSQSLLEPRRGHVGVGTL